MKKLKIVFIGTPDMAIICLDNLLKNNLKYPLKNVLMGNVDCYKHNDLL